MNFIHCKGYEEMSQLASGEILGHLQQKPALWLCAATGYSPLGTYRNLAGQYARKAPGLNSLGIVKLDEWWGIPAESQGSCETYLRKELLSPLNIPAERYISLDSEAADPELECLRVSQQIDELGRIDICLLGLGRNGHLGLNEPASQLFPECHVSRLTAESIGHSMLESLQDKPTLGLTLGMADILKSRRIILLVTGEGKNTAMESLRQQKIDPGLPVSLLWLHPDVSCFLDDSTVS